MPNTIKLNVEPSLTVITLNRPEKRNALNPEMIAELTEAFSNADRPVVLRAEGKAFCAGMDLDHLFAMMDKSYEENLDDARRLAALFYRIWNFPQPVIAAVQGPALAGGCGLAAVCDHILAVPTAKFGYTEVAIGFLPAIVSIFVETGRDLLETGRLIEALEAQSIGWVREIVTPEKLDSRAREFVFTAGNRVRHTVTPAELERACIANTEARFTPECQAGVRAFLEKRQLPRP